jgi:hypothetical protein
MSALVNNLAAMALPKNVYLPRDCYSGFQVRQMLGRRDPATNEVKPIGRNALMWQRKKGHVPFVQFTARTIMYPRDLIDAKFKAAQSSL